jgi:DNA-binding response OmpR family regulator
LDGGGRNRSATGNTREERFGIAGLAHEGWAMSRVVLVEDDEAIAEILRFNLEAAGHHVLAACDGVDGLHLAQNGAPDVVLLDVMLPRMDGHEVCRRLRRCATTPVIMLTAREDLAAKLFDLGADDYIMKPFSIREVLTHIAAIVRRPDPACVQAGELPEVEAFGNFVMDRAAWRVIVDGSEVHLALREFKLLSFLLAQSGCTHTRETLIENVWDSGFCGGQKTVNVHIRWLREKFTDRVPFEISAVRGVGYRLDRLPVSGREDLDLAEG